MAFHSVDGPNTQFLGKLLDPRVAESLLLPFLVEGESYITKAVFNSKNRPIDMYGHGTQGHLFLTNLRILFWPDGSAKPTLGLELTAISGYQTHWMPMKMRALTVNTQDGSVMFASSKRAIEEIVAKLAS
jgi:hypothetical protein